MVIILSYLKATHELIINYSFINIVPPSLISGKHTRKLNVSSILNNTPKKKSIYYLVFFVTPSFSVAKATFAKT